MTAAGLSERERALLAEMSRLSAERAGAEAETEAGFRARQQAADSELKAVLRKVETRFASEEEELTTRFEGVRQDLSAHLEVERRATAKSYSTARRRIATSSFASQARTAAEFDEARWRLKVAHERARAVAHHEHQSRQARLARERRRLDAVRHHADRLFRQWGVRLSADGQSPPAALAGEKPFQEFRRQVGAARAELVHARDRAALRYLLGKRFFLVVALFWLVTTAPVFAVWPAGPWSSALGQWPVKHWLLGAGLATVVGAVALFLWARAVARAECRRLERPLRLADACHGRCERVLRARHEKKLAWLRQRHTAANRKVERRYQDVLLDGAARAEHELWEAEEVGYRGRLVTLEEKRQSDDAAALDKFTKVMVEVRRRHETGLREAEERHRRLVEENRTRHEADREALATTWRDGMARAKDEAVALCREVAGFFPALEDGWQPPDVGAPALRFGEVTLRTAELPGGLPQDPALRAAAPEVLTLPALTPLPAGCALWVEGGPAPEQVLRTWMLRLLTALPPGQVRFTVLDPVGLGHGFSAFMHLADYLEPLVGGRIWTERQDIEERLGELTGHLEKVIQKYLRNEFATIEEYNARAGELAEPYRVLVVNHFPTQFTSDMARRLSNLAAVGPRCGVHTIIARDADRPLPEGFQASDFTAQAVRLVWREGRYVWEDRDYSALPLVIDTPPAGELLTGILRQVGSRAKAASRVEVPFEAIAPPPERWWTAATRQDIDVPLGRAGATKLLHFQLGVGTSQHALVAGKTGSGKSTLLHALITNAAMVYSPQELELYLVDFKEGVEFKPYATHDLPHARVVAIESEREFGLSVLQRLQGELQARGDQFRGAAVQDINGYRESAGAPLPRVLLIVDEFQQFFVQDDKIAQEAALLLDRLVRQGRAFGIHVLLGSQTLGGAYSLARSTVGQMTVRIALQCSESDTHLILSEENTAAHLLGRPGEAIYNDASGLAEANEFFQVAWLSDQARESYLRQIAALARERRLMRSEPQIVFEGKAPADPAKNRLLAQLLSAPAWPATPRTTRAWLGDAIAIKDPTAAVFRPQTGNNLLIVGQDEESALGILATTLIGLAAQHSPAEGARFYVLDGSPADAPHAGLLPALDGVLPHSVRVVGWRELAAVMAELAEEVERRQGAADTTPPFAYLLVYGLQRFRDLRQQEEDFGFSRRGSDDEPPSPARLFGTILRDGPAVGVYTIAWCDGLNNLTRTLDRQGMREFEMRVLFQMSQGDSGTLIDAPLASQLGPHRALFHSEEKSHPETFRPYDVPRLDWLAAVKEQFGRKSEPSPAH
jgi:hypothetical protein